jgi:hypothetical protein
VKGRNLDALALLINTMNLVLLVMLTVSVIATSESRGETGRRYCGWELMQNLRTFICDLSCPPPSDLISPQRFPYPNSATGTQSKQVIALYAYFRMMVPSTALVFMSVETVFGGPLKRVGRTAGGMETIAARGSGNQDVRSTVILGYVMDRVEGVEAGAELRCRCAEAAEGYV